MNTGRHKLVLVVVFLLCAWNTAAWFFTKNHYLARERELVEQSTHLSRERAADLADSIRRNLNYLHGIPDVFAELLRVKAAVTRFGPGVHPSTLPLETRKKRWTEDPQLNDLSRYLELAKVSLNVDIIYLIDAGGDCIAASNWNTAGTTIGTNFLDRDFYVRNKNGQRGMQYAVGKTTHIPGLYFSTPVFIDGRFMGAIIAKTDIPNLSFLIKQLDAFVTDENGVVVLAQNPGLEMHALAGAVVGGLSEQKKFARYRRLDFPLLKTEPWGEPAFPALIRIQNEYNPHVLISTDIPEYKLKAYVGEEITAIRSLHRDAAWFAFLLETAGSVLILIGAGAFLYWNSLKTAEMALGRANLAERRIISISEDTQQRIGQELHDDLGQLLTGTAFMCEMLSSKLRESSPAEAQDIARITALINQAVSKTRNLAHGLFPVEMKEAGLPAMLATLARNVSETYRMDCEFTCPDSCRIDDQMVAINLFRIAQEAVNNAIKHSGATRIGIHLHCAPGETSLEISDNGSGIGETAGMESTAGIGIRSMHYRASLLGGSLHIRNLPGGGTHLSITFPT